MTPERFADCLAALGWSQRGFATLVAVDERQVRRWAEGATIPARVAEWLDKLAKFHEANPPPAAPKRPTPRYVLVDLREGLGWAYQLEDGTRGEGFASREAAKEAAEQALEKIKG